MKPHLLLLIPLLLLASCNSLNKSKDPTTHPFTNIRPGDRIHVQFESKGCFHHDAADFDFAYDTATSQFLVSIFARNLVKGHTSHKSGTLVLTRRDLAGLDRVIRFYRKEHLVGGYTSHDTIKLQRFRQSGTTGHPVTETFHDSSSDLSDARHTTFASLMARLRMGAALSDIASWDSSPRH